MRTRQVTVGLTPTSLLDLLGIPKGQRGTWSLKMQSPAANTADILWGDKSSQVMILAATGITEETIPGVNLRDFFLVAASDQLLNVTIWQ